MRDRIPDWPSISDPGRDTGTPIERERAQQEPAIITQGDEAAAILVPVELSRELERRRSPRLVSPRLVDPADAERFQLAVDDPNQTGAW